MEFIIAIGNSLSGCGYC